MTDTPKQVLAGGIIDEETAVTLAEICVAADVDAAAVTAMVEYGIVEPAGSQPEEWCFSGVCLRRVITVARLQRDLGVNLAGAALAVDLLDEIEVLRRRLGG